MWAKIKIISTRSIQLHKLCISFQGKSNFKEQVNINKVLFKYKIFIIHKLLGNFRDT